MAISIHPYLTGVPHRIKYLEMLYDYILGHEGVVHVDRRGDPRLVPHAGASRTIETISRQAWPALTRRPSAVRAYLSSQNVSKRTTS